MFCITFTIQKSAQRCADVINRNRSSFCLSEIYVCLHSRGIEVRGEVWGNWALKVNRYVYITFTVFAGTDVPTVSVCNENLFLQGAQGPRGITGLPGPKGDGVRPLTFLYISTLLTWI